jgi:glycosyltransferase involved in cell wall biosynthesis
MVTIVTACRNSQAYLEETIDSVARQTYPNIEYIVVDGGSTDGTLDIIGRHADVISRWVSEPDQGQADALRKGFAMAQGEVLGWINSDDVYPADAVQVAVAALQDSGADVVYGNRVLIDSSARRVGERRLSPFLPFFSRRGVLYGGFGIYQPAALWTRELYDRAGGIDPTYQFCMDTELITRFVMAGAAFRFLRRDMVQFRIHQDSKTSSMREVARREQERIARGLPQRSRAYRSLIKLTCRAWKVLYQLRDTQGRYLVKRALDRKYRFVP